MSVLCAVGGVGIKAYLGRDQGRQSAALDEAHLDGWHTISINWPVAVRRLGSGCGPGLARRWSGDGDRAVGEVQGKKAARRDLPAPSPSNHPSFIPSTSRTSTSATSTTHHHVCPTEDNRIEVLRACPAALCDQGYRPYIPHVCDQRADTARTQDDFRGCARRQAHERFDPDPGGRSCRGNEASARLQCCCGLPDFVRHTGIWTQTRTRLTCSQQLLPHPQACHGR